MDDSRTARAADKRGAPDRGIGWDPDDIALIHEQAEARIGRTDFASLSCGGLAADDHPAPPTLESPARGGGVDPIPHQVPEPRPIVVLESGNGSEADSEQDPLAPPSSGHSTAGADAAAGQDLMDTDLVILAGLVPGFDGSEHDAAGSAAEDVEEEEDPSVVDLLLLEDAFEGFVGEAEDDAPHSVEKVDTNVVLSRQERAEKMAYELMLTTGFMDREAFPVLVDIFHESPWPATRRSVEDLVVRGVGVEALALAAAIRRVWLDHPEFARSVPTGLARMAWARSPQALATFPWQAAADLAESWSSYPDVDEIGCHLETLFDDWTHDPHLRRQFPNFRLFIVHLASSVREPLDSWIADYRDRSADWVDPFCRLEQSDAWFDVRRTLEEHEIDLPRTWKRSIKPKKKRTEAEESDAHANITNDTNRGVGRHKPEQESAPAVSGRFRYGWYET